MIIHIIACVADNNVIGLNGGMPWPKLRADLDRFKYRTGCSPVIMGSTTFKSIKNPLLDRLNVVLTSKFGDSFTSSDNVVTAPSLPAAFSYLEANHWQYAYVIGGQSVYEQALYYADYMHITELYESYDGDTFFPDFDATQWKREYYRSIVQKDEAGDRHMAFTRYKKRNF